MNHRGDWDARPARAALRRMVRSAPATLAAKDGGPIGSIARLQRLFDVLDRAGIRWSLLRPPALLAQPEGDVDLLVDPVGKETARAAILDEGFVPIPIAGGDLHAVAYDLDPDRFLWLHVQTELRLGGESLPASAVLATAARDPLPRPTDTWLFWILILHDVLDKRAVPERHRGELMRLASVSGPAPPALQALAAKRRLDSGALVSLVQAGAWGELQGRADQLARPRRAPGQRAKAAADRVSGLWNRRGLSVAIIGPDGAGKSTLVRGLHGSLPFPTRTIYGGLTGGRLPKADALRVPGVVFAARLMLLWTRYLVGAYHRARGRIVLFDRYVLDGKVPSGAALTPLGKVSRRLQAGAVPRPDLVLVLDASGASMHGRKGEYEPARLEEWRGAYQRLDGTLRGLEVLDAERPADAVRRDARARIWRCYAERWRP